MSIFLAFSGFVVLCMGLLFITAIIALLITLIIDKRFEDSGFIIAWIISSIAFAICLELLIFK